jgi:hypothetical protein
MDRGWDADLYQCWGDVLYLRRIALTPGAHPQPVPGVSGDLSITQLLASGDALATETARPKTLWRVDLGSIPAELRATADPGCPSAAPDCSPDGRHRVFITTRTGISEIWLENADGTDERPLVQTIPAFANPKDDGVPTLVGWSPDGRWIAFTTFARSGNADTRAHLFVVPSSGGPPRRLGKEAYPLSTPTWAYALSTPTWSRDSKALYATQGWPFEDGAHHPKSPIMHVDIADGSLQPVGVEGIWPKVSSDGRLLYYFTWPSPKLFRVPIAGGPEQCLWDKGRLSGYNSAIGARYVYLFQESSRGREDLTNTLIRLDPESRLAITLADIPFRPRFAYLSSDERFLYVGQEGNETERVVLVHGLF